jgi:hypothetical protein
MSRKILLAISLLLPLVAMSGMANAGSTITDKSYWPSETRSTYGTPASGGDWRSALAFDRRSSRYQPLPSYGLRESDWTYLGGPKSPTMRTPHF